MPSTTGNGLGNPYWTYTADGQKLKADDREYADGIEYLNGELYAIHHAEGRIFPNKQTEQEIANHAAKVWQYQFYLRDHLGNTRIVIDESGKAIQEDNYYPFGMKQELNDGEEDEEERSTRFLYNGKEMNEDLGMYDYGARFYDPSICRWNSVDPWAESYYSYSPYNYVLNNPIIFIDPDGRGVETKIVNADTGASTNIDDRYTHTMELSDDQYNAVIANAEANGAENAFSSRAPGSKVNGLTDFAWSLGAGFNGGAQGVSEIPGVLIDTYGETAVGILGTWLAGRGMISKPLPSNGPLLRASTLEARAKAVHGAVPAATQRRTTIAAGVTKDGTVIIGSSEKNLRRSQRAALKPGEVAATGQGHAEVTVINHARSMGLNVTGVAASRPICSDCEGFLKSSNVTPMSPLKSAKKKN